MSVKTHMGRFEWRGLPNDQSGLQYKVCTQFEVGITNICWNTHSSVVPPPSNAVCTPV